MSDFTDAINLGYETAMDIMGEEIILPDGDTLVGIVEAPEISRNRVGFGGRTDVVSGTIHVSRQRWSETGHTDGAIIEFRGVQARVMVTVPGHGDRLELRLQPVNLFEGP